MFNKFFEYLKQIKKEQPIVFCKDCVYCSMDSSGIAFATCIRNLKEKSIIA